MSACSTRDAARDNCQFLSLHAGDVIGVDSNPSAITYATDAFKAPNLQFRLGQFDDLKDDKPFDRIYCIEVIEHLYEHQVADVLSLFYKLAIDGDSSFLLPRTTKVPGL